MNLKLVSGRARACVCVCVCVCDIFNFLNHHKQFEISS